MFLGFNDNFRLAVLINFVLIKKKVYYMNRFSKILYPELKCLILSDPGFRILVISWGVLWTHSYHFAFSLYPLLSMLNHIKTKGIITITDLVEKNSKKCLNLSWRQFFLKRQFFFKNLWFTHPSLLISLWIFQALSSVFLQTFPSIE